MWLLFAIFAGLAFATLNIVERHLLKGDESDPLTFSFFFSFTSTLLLLPFVIYQPPSVDDLSIWILLIIVSAFLVANNFLNFTAIKYTSASIVGTIGKFRIVWAFLLGLALAYEVWSPYKGIGVLLTLIAGTVLVAKFNKSSNNPKGIFYAFISTFFGATAIVIYTPLLEKFNVLSLTFLIFAIPALMNFLLLKNPLSRIKAKYQKQSWRLFIAGLLGVSANLAIVAAINLSETSRVLVIVEALFIVVLVAEHFILKEKKQLLRKGIAAVLATIGAILMRIAS